MSSLRCRISHKSLGRPLVRRATTSKIVTRLTGVRNVYSEIDPSKPEEEEVTTKIRTGLFAPFVYHAEYLDPTKYSLSRAPIYQASSSFHVSATKRVAWTIAIIGGYFSSAMLTMDGIPTALALLVGIPSVLPLPIVSWLTTPYVHRIFRIYSNREGERVDLEKLKEDEEFIFECISVFGRSLYNYRVKLSDLRVASKRFGWVNLEVVGDHIEKIHPKQNIVEKALDGTRTRRYFYVADDVGGYKMERIWSIIDRQSGVDNGRD
ncbi:hypothetical protein V1525DRAFT_396191 [Lipomyces kononenkoae]|uniref:Uncharacterized protein n=1 Tax=Lipomyces kononenkoae TaxID=34357 RepID=A0ACC3T8C9_LIPKO